MKKILIVRGGGRPNGNTAQLAAAFAGGAREAGHVVEEVSLSQVQVNGCLGCNACRYQKPCVQKDGWGTLMPKILDADLLVLASPLYFWTPLVQTEGLYRAVLLDCGRGPGAADGPV